MCWDIKHQRILMQNKKNMIDLDLCDDVAAHFDHYHINIELMKFEGVVFISSYCLTIFLENFDDVKGIVLLR